jgi:AcrR family transcriptional regulator
MASETETRRRYRKRRRAEAEAETRRRITEAAVRLHGTVGPAKTTVSGIARAAGVQRATVYRHFPDEEAMYEACTSHFRALHPPPDLDRWAELRDPEERLRTALREIYAYYAETGQMFASTSRDVERVPAVRKAAAAMDAYREQARAVLLHGRRARGRAREHVTAAIGHALAFPTWRSLVREQGLGDEEAVALMASFVDTAGSGGR